MARFAEVLTIVNGRNQKAVEDPSGIYPIYGSGGIMGYANDYICDAETVIIGRKGSINKPIYVETAFWNVDTAFGLSADRKKLLPKYLFYFCETYDFEKLNTTVTIPSLTKANLLNVEIPLPPLDQQRHIAAVLDKVSELIALRKQQLAKLDELVKARFVEMFGDQETNPHNLDVGKLSDVAGIYLGLTHTPTYVEQGRPFLSVRDISSGAIDFSNCHYITEEEFCSLPNGARPKVGDMLFCRVGTIGKPVIIPEDTPEFGTFVSVGYLRKKTNVNNQYLKSWMENEYFMRQVYDNVAGASQINLNTGWLKNFRILIPSMELQNQFAAFVEQTDKSKLAVQQALDKLETLKKALMQEYFG